MVTPQESSGSGSKTGFDVFLSFRGEDTRRNFTDHLYAALVAAGYCTYKDDEEIELGENIQSELRRAIQHSRVSIVVFSKDYASSGWCLDELVMILEHKRTSGLVVLPVFYYVDPSQVSNQIGCVAAALSRHEERFNMENEEIKFQLMEKVRMWRAALREVADIREGFSRNQFHGREPRFIQKIVKAVARKLNRGAFGADPYQFGMDGSTGVSIMSICGMGGIGKTTMAKFVYDLNHENFEAASFVHIGKFSEHPNGLVSLQRKLLSDILKKEPREIYNVDEGLCMIRDALAYKRVLIVLDDVDHEDSLTALLGMRDWLCPGSKIIITTRNKWLLRCCNLHEVKELNDEESLELFSWHAFGQGHPIEGYKDLAQRLVQLCGGLPLAVIVVGASLSGKSVAVWESAIEKLKEVPQHHVLSELRISYDSLMDDHDKQLFLHIACFFVGMDKDYVTIVLDACGFFTIVGIQNLIDRSLLSVDQGNRLMMHQSLQDMGRAIVWEESPREPGFRSRLCRHKDALNVLTERTGTETIEGLIIDFHVPGGNKPVETRDSKRSHSEAFRDKSTPLCEGNSSKRSRLGLFSWLPVISALVKSPSLSDENVIQTDAFLRMSKLLLLQLNNVHLAGDYAKLPQSLRWLCWRGFSLKSLPADFPMDNLAVLDMRYSNMKQVWKKTKFLPSLKILNLSHSHDLISTPDFSRLPNLEILILKDCINLIEVNKSVMGLERLCLLNLKGCIKLRKLPRQIRRLQSLEKLNLSGCSNLDEVPEEL